LAIYGGIIGAVVTAAIFAKVRKIEILKLFDFGAPYLVLGQAIGRWGNFVNQEAFGTNTRLPWGMTSSTIQSELARLRMEGMRVDPSVPVHPTFLYESLWDLAVFFMLIWYRKRKKLNGEVFFLYMSLYGIGRFFIEGIRLDSLYVGNLRVSQLLAFLFAVFFGILFVVRRVKAARISEETTEAGSSKYGEILKRIREEEALEQVSEGEGAERETMEPETADKEAPGQSAEQEDIVQPAERVNPAEPTGQEIQAQPAGQENTEQTAQQG